MMNYLPDLLIISLLIMAIIFCIKLNKRLKTMREMGEDLSPFMKNLSLYLQNISSSIDKLKTVADISEKGLNHSLPAAKALKDDFDILLEHADKIAARLDDVIEKARAMDHQLHHTMQLTKAHQRNDGTFSTPETSLTQEKMAYKNPMPNTLNRPQNRTTENQAYGLAEPKDFSPYEEEPFTTQHINNGTTEQYFSQPTENNAYATTHTAQGNRAYSQQPRSQAIPITERGIMEKLKGIR